MRRGGVILLALALVVVAAAPAGAAKRPDPSAAKRERQRQIGKEIATLRSQVAEASAQESALLEELDTLDGRIADLSGRVGALDSRILAAQAELGAAQARLDELEGRYRRAYEDLQRMKRRLRSARIELRSRAVAAYTEGPMLRAYTGAFLDSGVRELAARNGYLDSVIQRQQVLVDRFRILREEAEDQTEVLEASRAEALTQRDVVASRKSTLQAARREQDGVRQQVLAQTNRRASVLSEVRSRKAEFEQQIAALKAESNSIAAFLRSRQAGQGIRPSGSGVLASPIPGAAITSSFGSRYHPIFHEWRSHTGIDFRGSSGTPIRAAADGEVAFAGSRGGYGYATIIDHGGSLATLYAHQSSILVSPGQNVRRGQVIGRVGSTGFSTGPHLHFEVRVAGNPVNPLAYL